ncbi:bacteriocin [Pseudoramibacter alactolyticus]|uniref:bacteriocin n=1 Tax=Pseudoramibacter alactolyticus TaxID=113287 RepID=UPI0028ED9921|nr:bacteriocin [Pseudoramibacter alactolyticus]
MSEFNTLTERELANVSGGGRGGIAFTIASEIPDFIKGIQKGYSKAKKRNKRRKNIN